MFSLDLELWLESGASRSLQISKSKKEYIVVLKDAGCSITARGTSLVVALDDALFYMGRVRCGAV